MGPVWIGKIRPRMGHTAHAKAGGDPICRRCYRFTTCPLTRLESRFNKPNCHVIAMIRTTMIIDITITVNLVFDFLTGLCMVDGFGEGLKGTIGLRGANCP